MAAWTLSSRFGTPRRPPDLRSAAHTAREVQVLPCSRWSTTTRSPTACPSATRRRAATSSNLPQGGVNNRIGAALFAIETDRPAPPKMGTCPMTRGCETETPAGERGAHDEDEVVVSLTTGLEDAEKVTVAFLVAVGSAENAARPDVPHQGSRPPGRRGHGPWHGVPGMPAAGDPCRYAERRPLPRCPICFDARSLDKGDLLPNAERAAPCRCGRDRRRGSRDFSY